MSKNDIFDRITSKLITKLESGVVPWRRTWSLGVPVNFVSKRPYCGINFLSLIAEEHPSPFYLTFLQAKEKGIRINTGSSGALILFWKLLESAKDDESLVKKTPFIRHSYVFNLSQTSLNEEVAEHDGIVSAEDLILKMNNLPVIKNNYRRCAYSVTDDFITIPVISDFETKEEYYSAFFMKPYTQLVILSA